jgi:hypothetical protein
MAAKEAAERKREADPLAVALRRAGRGRTLRTIARGPPCSPWRRPAGSQYGGTSASFAQISAIAGLG